MKVPPASTNRSRMAKDVVSSVRLPISIAPRLSTLTSRRVAWSLPIVRYLIYRVSEMESTLSQTDKPGHRPPDPGRVQPVERSVIGGGPRPPRLRAPGTPAPQPGRARGP